MRSDPYQERARALAVEAGLDPDAKIDRPGQRPMPTWCLFRDAARKEKLARDAEGVASEIAVRPQAAQYQNSPLKVFGKHEDATIAQMRNCMSVANAVAGVICADGHLGYAQPVGGVIAYDQHLRLRHRLRQHGRAPRHAVHPDREPCRHDHQGRAQSDLVRRRPYE